MRAVATLVAERGEDGRTRLPVLRSQPPLTLRDTGGAVHLVGSAAGPLGGDELSLEVTVGAGAALVVRSVAAQLVHPAPVPARSTLLVEVRVDDGASLDWRPEPVIVVRGADHEVRTRLVLSGSATVVWCEEVVLGRHGEEGGSVLQGLRVERDRRPLLHGELALGPAWPGAHGPAGAGPARVVSQTLVVGGLVPPARVVSGEVRGGVALLADDAALVTVLGPELEPVRALAASLLAS